MPSFSGVFSLFCNIILTLEDLKLRYGTFLRNMELGCSTTRSRWQILRQSQTKLIFKGVKSNCEIFSTLAVILLMLRSSRDYCLKQSLKLSGLFCLHLFFLFLIWTKMETYKLLYWHVILNGVFCLSTNFGLSMPFW